MLISFPNDEAFGQFRVVHQPDHLHPVQDINLFLELDGSERLDGAYLALPATWQLRGVTLVGNAGRSSEMSVRKLEQATNRYLLIPARRMTEGDQVILNVRVGELTGAYSMRVTPIRAFSDRQNTPMELLDALSVRTSFRIDERQIIQGNTVLKIEASPSDPKAVFDGGIAGDDAFTFELWLSTVSRNAIVASTWDGGEETSYPMELLLDESGHAVFFRGVPGEHRSMRSPEPVADGSWHHVAVVHDESLRWSRLLIDGVPADSIFHMTSLPVLDSGHVILGGRLRGSASGSAGMAAFVGMVDEIRLWAGARTAADVRRDMRRTIPEGNAVRVRSFEETDSYSYRETEDGITTRVRSDLSFYEPIGDLVISLDVSSILLQWQAPDPNAVYFVVERSSDGASFEPIARIEKGDPVRYDPTARRYLFRDTKVSFGVTYYRVRQTFVDGVESVSRAFKVGMGSDAGDENARILGNFPNPFNPITTITYFLAESEPIQLSVWDLSGQMIALLVDGQADAGEHHVPFDATELPSGTYFVRMRTPDGIRSHQIILMK